MQGLIFLCFLAPILALQDEYEMHLDPNSSHVPIWSRRLSPSTVEDDKACIPHFEIRDPKTGKCQCRNGFQGWECRRCKDDKACQVALGSSWTCAQGLEYHDHTNSKSYSCELSKSLKALFSDGTLDINCDRNVATHKGNCSVAIYKKKTTVRGEHAIDCHLTNCSLPDGPGSSSCGLIECKCGRQCSGFTKALVEHTLSGKPADIHVTNGSHVSIDIQDSPMPLEATCKASACEKVGSGSESMSGSGSAGPIVPTNPLIVLAVVAAFFILTVGSIYMCVQCTAISVDKERKRYSDSELDAEIAALRSQSGRVLEFRHLSCRSDSQIETLDGPQQKEILRDISGRAHRGAMLGLLGPSGSGKTSLLNVLAAVENGKTSVSGSITVDGREISKQFRKIAAYVQQDDCLYPTLTVRECILYSAQLRLPATTPQVVKHEVVDRVMDELKIKHVADEYIGSNGNNRGISGGERRRVSIGMELATSPQILFLDEPTSGLDSTAANNIVEMLSELARHGRIVILSIHQPSTKSFFRLDQTMLLAKGRLVYSGPPSKAKSYFESQGYPFPQDENVADYLLDIISDDRNVSSLEKTFDISRTDLDEPLPTDLEQGKLSRDTSQVVHDVASPRAGASSLSDTSLDSPGSPTSLLPVSKRPSATPKRSLRTELSVLFRRTAQNIFRQRSLFLMQMFLSLALALCGGLIFHHVTNDLAGFQNRMGAFYFVLTFFSFASMSSMELFLAERVIFLRESGAMYYGAFSYFLAKATLDVLLLRVLPASVFASIFYWIMGLQPELGRFLLFMATVVLFNIAAGSISVFMGVVCKNVGAANLTATVVFLIMLLFGGFLLSATTMPASVGWIQNFSIFHYGFEILMTNELKGLLMKFDAPGYPSVPVYGDVYLKTLGMDYKNRFHDLAALGVIILTLQVLSFIGLALQVPTRPNVEQEEQDDEPITEPTTPMDEEK